MKKLLTQFLVAMFIVPMLSLVVVNTAAAADPAPSDLWGGPDNEQSVQDTLLLGERDPRDIAAQVINVILGFLGIVAVIIILAGGFKWMTAGGNQDKVDEAKKLMSAGVVGLLIILAAFGIARFVINALVTATTSQ